jgi:hypothetical protein
MLAAFAPCGLDLGLHFVLGERRQVQGVELLEGLRIEDIHRA